jgi:signal transduction histidine kinase
MHFQIKDYGLGISEYDQAHIFEAFYTGNRVRNEKNTGVGLTLVKKIVDKLNGRITLDSIENEYTIFDVYLPLNT